MEQSSANFISNPSVSDPLVTTPNKRLIKPHRFYFAAALGEKPDSLPLLFRAKITVAQPPKKEVDETCDKKCLLGWRS
jgi:hypothetical protein